MIAAVARGLHVYIHVTVSTQDQTYREISGGAQSGLYAGLDKVALNYIVLFLLCHIDYVIALSVTINHQHNR